MKNVIGFSHGCHIELMVWKYPKVLQAMGQEQIAKAQTAATENKAVSWHFYE